MEKEECERLKKNGLIKNVSQAFKDYPVEEEIHQGNINYFINELETIYGNYQVGDIVLINNYQYEDGTIGTNHLFVIIDLYNKAVPMDYFGMILSSRIEKINYNYNRLIKKDDKNNLRYDSLIKLDQTYILLKENIIGKIGCIENDKIQEYKKIYNNFKLKEV